MLSDFGMLATVDKCIVFRPRCVGKEQKLRVYYLKAYVWNEDRLSEGQYS